MIQYDPHRWFDHFFDLRGSALREILGRLAGTVFWSVAVVAAHVYWRPMAIPSTMHSLTGFAIGMLLVFRTNASYDRYWEGRRLWGGLVNAARNLVRATESCLQGGELTVAIARWTAAFPFAVMYGLRGVAVPEAGLPGQLQAELRQVRNRQHVAVAVAEQLSALVQRAKREGKITEVMQASLEVYIKELVDCLGGCERIRNTPLPFAYVVHLRRVIVLYCLTLPFALVESYGWLTVVDVWLVSFVFYGIEEIGVEIEGPFGFDANDLPLEEMCQTIQNNVFAIASVTEGAETAAPEPASESL